MLNQFLSSNHQENSDSYTNSAFYNDYEYLFGKEFQETSSLKNPLNFSIYTIDKSLELSAKPTEISPRKFLNINSKLDFSKQQKLIKILQKKLGAIAWEYEDMRGIHPDTCIHHIYTQENAKPIRQFQRRMNPSLKDIVKDELHKLLNANFIYPISDSKWVSPLVIVPKKNEKWRVCVDFRELNKATLQDYFPLPFIDQVLHTLSGKKYFSFLDGYSGYNQIQIALEDQDKTTFTCP